MWIIVNGDPMEVLEGVTVASVVATVTAVTHGVAVALNDTVVPRGDWATTTIRDADRLEVLTAVQGG